MGPLIDQLIVALTFAAALTSVPWDDAVVRFLKFARNDEAFKRWIDSILPAKVDDGTIVVETNQMVDAPPEVAALFDKFKLQVGAEKAGNFNELIAMLFEAIAWWKAFQAKRNPPAAAAG
jgi:hypothetical protein